MLIIKQNWMFVNAGIDESNAANQYSLWPQDPQKSVNAVWRFLRQRYRVKKVGVLVMGEGDEQTPMAVVTGVKRIVFQTQPPTDEELKSLKIKLADDAYAPILLKAGWKRGGG